VGGVAGASGAWFSDSEESVGNTFTAGVIDISLNPTDGQDAVSVEGDLDLKPCMTGYIKVRVTNDGNNPVEVWKHLKDVVNEENGKVDAEQKEYDDHNMDPTATPAPWDMNISDWIMYDMWIHHGCVMDNNNTNNAEVDFNFDPGVDRMIIAETDGFTVTGFTGIECFWIYLGVLQPGESMVIIQSYHLKSVVTNWAQSDRMTFTMEFFGQQTQGVPQPDPPQPGPDSQGELPGWGRGDAPAHPCPECLTDGDCPDDGVFCNGVEGCDNGTCVSSGDPCVGGGEYCCEDPGACFTGDECCLDGDCADQNICVDGFCVPGPI
jgi:predicted ribosomally synthesized peptide with SipW-like signal peptide